MNLNKVKAELCSSYYDSHGQFYPIKVCDLKGPYCCGICTERVCCDDISFRLNQGICNATTTKPIDLLNPEA